MTRRALSVPSPLRQSPIVSFFGDSPKDLPRIDDHWEELSVETSSVLDVLEEDHIPDAFEARNSPQNGDDELSVCTLSESDVSEGNRILDALEAGNLLTRNGDHERTSSMWEKDDVLRDLEAGNLPPLGNDESPQISLTILYWMDPDEKIKLTDAQGNNKDRRIQIALGENLPATMAIRRECNFYRAENGEIHPISEYFSWNVLRRYIKRTGRSREITLSVYKRAAPIRPMLFKIAAIIFLIAAFVASVILSRGIRPLRGWKIEAFFVFVALFFAALAKALYGTPFAPTKPWHYFLREYYWTHLKTGGNNY